MTEGCSGLVVALQFYQGDWYRAVKLARLLADLEQRRRDDVTLLFVRTSECPSSRILDDAVARCSEVFRVESLVLRPDTPERRVRWGQLNKWPFGCNVLWEGAAGHFLRMDSKWSTIFTVDGGDGVPLYRDWVDLLVGDHVRTLRSGKLVTGCVRVDGVGRRHVNGNVVIERSFLEQHPEVLSNPLDGVDAWDVHHAPSVLPSSRGSSSVRCDWKLVGICQAYFSVIAERSVWWHGWKDGNFVDLARDFVLGGSAGVRPSIQDLKWPALGVEGRSG